MKRILKVVAVGKQYHLVLLRPRLFGLLRGNVEFSREVYESRSVAYSLAYRIIDYRRHKSKRPEKFKEYYFRLVENRTVNDLLARPKLYETHIRYMRRCAFLEYKIGASRHLPVSELFRHK